MKARGALAKSLLILALTGCSPEQNNSVVLDITGRVTNSEGAAIAATVTLYEPGGFISSYVQLSQMPTTASGHYAFTVRTSTWCRPAVRVEAPGYHTEWTDLFSNPLECTSKPQRMDFVMQPRP